MAGVATVGDKSAKGRNRRRINAQATSARVRSRPSAMTLSANARQPNVKRFGNPRVWLCNASRAAWRTMAVHRPAARSGCKRRAEARSQMMLISRGMPPERRSTARSAPPREQILATRRRRAAGGRYKRQFPPRSSGDKVVAGGDALG
jgi:hypothetical protein